MVLTILSSRQCRGLLLTAAFWCRCLLPLCVFFLVSLSLLLFLQKEKKSKERSHGSLFLCVSKKKEKEKEEVDQQALLFVTEERAHTRAQLHSCFDLPILISLFVFFFFFTPSLPFCFFDTYCKYTHTHTCAPDIRGVFFFTLSLFFTYVVSCFCKVAIRKATVTFFFFNSDIQNGSFFFLRVFTFFFLHTYGGLSIKKKVITFFFLKYIGKSLFSVLKRRERH